MKKAIFVLVGIALMILAAGCISTPAPTMGTSGGVAVLVTYPITPAPTESENLTESFVSYFNAEPWVRPYNNAPKVTRSPELNNIAMSNAINGTHSFNIRANSTDEAFEVFNQNEWSNYNHYGVQLSMGVGWVAGASWGVATYHYGDHYNVSVVYETAPYTHTVKGVDGVYSTVTNPVVPQYLFNDASGAIP